MFRVSLAQTRSCLKSKVAMRSKDVVLSSWLVYEATSLTLAIDFVAVDVCLR